MDADSDCNQSIYLNGTNSSSPTVYNLTTAIGVSPYDTLSSDVFRVVGESRDGTILYYFDGTSWAFYNPSVNSVYFEDLTYKPRPNSYGTFFNFYYTGLDILSIRNVLFDGTGSYYIVFSFPSMTVRGVSNIILQDFYLTNVSSTVVLWAEGSTYITLKNVYWNGNAQV